MLLIPLHSFALLRSRTLSTVVGGGLGYCALPSPLIATMEHIVTHKGIKYVPVKVLTDPARKWVTSSWFSKLLGRAVKSNKMKKMTASDLDIHVKDAEGRPLGRRLGDFLILEDGVSLLPAVFHCG